MNLGFPEMLFLFVLALIIFGPKRLPEIGRQIGKGLAEFKRASSEFQSQIQEEVRKLELDEVKNTIAPISLQDTVSYTAPNTLTSAATATQGSSEIAASSTTDVAQPSAAEEPNQRANA